jgi:hypothetical protein
VEDLKILEAKRFVLANKNYVLFGQSNSSLFIPKYEGGNHKEANSIG